MPPPSPRDAPHYQHDVSEMAAEASAFYDRIQLPLARMMLFVTKPLTDRGMRDGEYESCEVYGPNDNSQILLPTVILMQNLNLTNIMFLTNGSEKAGYEKYRRIEVSKF